MMVHMSGYADTKPGGTAGVILMIALVPAMLFVWDESFFVPFFPYQTSPNKKEKENQNE